MMLIFTTPLKLYLFKDKNRVSLSIKVSDTCVNSYYVDVDDFERMALHGTFLIDANGMVRWQDISFEPFTDLNFLLKEADRLMKLEALSPSADSGEIVHATTSR